jgi:hypothetical protein
MRNSFVDLDVSAETDGLRNWLDGEGRRKTMIDRFLILRNALWSFSN